MGTSGGGGVHNTRVGAGPTFRRTEQMDGCMDGWMCRGETAGRVIHTECAGVTSESVACTITFDYIWLDMSCTRPIIFVWGFWFFFSMSDSGLLFIFHFSMFCSPVFCLLQTGMMAVWRNSIRGFWRFPNLLPPLSLRIPTNKSSEVISMIHARNNHSAYASKN